MSKLILASASPRRLELLNSTKVFPDIVEPSNIDESVRKKEKPKFYLKRICYEKDILTTTFHFCFNKWVKSTTSRVLCNNHYH